MRVLLLVVAATMLIGANAVQDRSVKEQRYALGTRICTKVMEEGLNGIDSDKYRSAVDSIKWERAEYCHCVGEEFADDPNDRFGLLTATGDATGEAMRAKIDDALHSCQPGVGDNADLAEDETGDDTADEDTRMCHMLLDDVISAPGFRADEVLATLKATRRSADDLCGCAAKKMPSDRQAFDTPEAEGRSPMIAYGGALAGAIEQCLR